MNIEQHLSRSENKTLARWMVLGKKIPWPELKAILNDLGCFSDEIPRPAAERAMVRWVKENQMRMRREIKASTSAPAAVPDIPAATIPITREIRRKTTRWTKPEGAHAFVAAHRKVPVLPAVIADGVLDEMKLTRDLAALGVRRDGKPLQPKAEDSTLTRERAAELYPDNKEPA